MVPGATARLLLVDDDPIVLDTLTRSLEGEGYDITVASDVARAMDALNGARHDLVITDVSMPTCDGFELLRQVRGNYPEVGVIMMTGYGTIESAVEAIKQGAYDYLAKPVIDDDVRMAVRRALQQQNLLAENRNLKQVLAERNSASNILTSDARMGKIFEVIGAVADSPSTVLITGESGTGKSLVARAIHERSARRDNPLIEVSCGALPDTLLESELFGYVRGAFTHAVVDKPGKFAAADTGTIFLDEISTASPQLQVKLLRILQDRCFEPLGSNDTINVNVRVILATNHDLWTQVQEGRFREDLYFRVNVVNIALPPLRERAGDIPLLTEHFLTKFQVFTGKKVDGFSVEAVDAMRRYTWPGNVRELENCVEHGVVLCRTSLIGTDDLPVAVQGSLDTLKGAAPTLRPGMTLVEALAGPEKQIIQSALEHNSGSRQETARQLGINRTTLYKKMKKYELLQK